MTRQFSAPLSLALLLFCMPALPALAAEADDANSIIADCGGTDLPGSAVDSCLERARVLDETDPSAQLQSLEAKLEERESGAENPVRAKRAAAAPASDLGAGYEARENESAVTQPDQGLQPDAAEPVPDGAAAQSPTAPTVDAAPDRPQSEGDAVSNDRTREPDADDEPPIADPPDSDSPRDPPGDDSAPPSDDPQ